MVRAPAVSAPQAIEEAPQPAAELAIPVVAAVPPAASPAASHASIEAEYAAALRRIVDTRTEVPDTAEYRLLKPSGSTQVCFTLDRSGSPSEVAVCRPSGSKILDAQARRIVASGSYPRHAFIVTIEFRS
jgi:outer membrane biosynthesis protein TonB